MDFLFSYIGDENSNSVCLMNYLICWINKSCWNNHSNVYSFGSFEVLRFESGISNRLSSSMTVTVCEMAHSVRLIKLIYPLSSLIITITGVTFQLASTAMIDCCPLLVQLRVF